MKKTPAITSPAAIDQIIARALALEPAARPDFLKLHSFPEVQAIHERLLGEAKAKTPRPVLERKVLAAFDGAASSNAAIEAHEPPRASEPETAQGEPEVAHDEEPAELGQEPAADDAPPAPQDAPDTDPPHADGGGDSAQQDAGGDAPGADGRDDGDGDDDEQDDEGEGGEPAASAKNAERLPPVGTVIVKRDRHGAERCRCEVTDEGILYVGKLYTSISAAALVAQRDLGLTSPTVNGYLFWQLNKRAAGERKQRAPKAAKDHGPALAKAWARYTELARAAIAANPDAIREQLGAECNAHNELVASAIAPAA